MTYIKLEDVQKMLDNFALNLTKGEFSLLVLHIKNDINSLPSINPEAMIEDMIEIRKNYSYPASNLGDRTRIVVKEEIITLEELLQKFKS